MHALCGCERPARFGHDDLCPLKPPTRAVADMRALAAAIRDALDLDERERRARQMLTDQGRPA